MLLDDNLVSIDGGDLTGGEITGEAIALTSFRKPGRWLPILLGVYLSNDAEGGSLTLKLQQSDTEDGTFEDISGSEITVPADACVPGPVLGYRIVPLGVMKPWMKIIATGSGFSAGTVFAGVVTEEVFPYEKGLYINKGEVQY